MTTQRFHKYPQREPRVFQRFLDAFEMQTAFKGIRYALSRYEHHPNGIQDYDIRVVVNQGVLTFDTQESTSFSRYGDLRIDYISAYEPADYRPRNLSELKNALAAGKIIVKRWGKVIRPAADYLIVEFRNGKTQWQVYDLNELHRMLPQLEKTGRFRTNRKQGESWGSAFLAVPEKHPILQAAKPKDLSAILAQAKRPT